MTVLVSGTQFVRPARPQRQLLAHRSASATTAGPHPYLQPVRRTRFPPHLVPKVGYTLRIPLPTLIYRIRSQTLPLEQRSPASSLRLLSRLLWFSSLFPEFQAEPQAPSNVWRALSFTRNRTQHRGIDEASANRQALCAFWLATFGPNARDSRAFVEAANIAIRMKAQRHQHIGLPYQRLYPCKGHGRAAVAVARYLGRSFLPGAAQTPELPCAAAAYCRLTRKVRPRSGKRETRRVSSKTSG